MSAAQSDVVEVPAELRDVQRLVLKGYFTCAALHIGLSVRDAGAARTFLGLLARPGGASGTVTTAAEWHRTTGVCLTAGITFEGLRALGVPEAELATFPAEFRAGAAGRAPVVGDEGPSRPASWLPWLRGATGGELHVLLSLLGTEQDIDDAVSRLAAQWRYGLRELGRQAARALPTDGTSRFPVVHFGYRDGHSQPTIERLPLIGLPDPLQRVPVGALVLGHALPGGDRRRLAYGYPVPGSSALGANGSFAAFRVLEQDVQAFEDYLQRQAARTGQSAELLAAKLCGRWRDGSPLVLRPGADDPVVADRDRLNDFDYAGGGSDSGVPDPDGLRCPLGSHIRRMNPRSTPVAGAPSVARHRRLVRRGMPYGPPYDPHRGDDGEPRGLVGLFIGASLRDSYEFVLREWANDGAFSPALGRTQDPLLGAHDRTGTSTFAVPGTSEEPLDGLTRFVTTRGGAYLFLPSATALRHLARTPPANPAAALPYAERHRRLATQALERSVSSRAVARDDDQWALLLKEFTVRRAALLRELLEEAPVLEMPRAVVVTRYADVREVLERADVFSVAAYGRAMHTINRGAPFVLGMDDDDQRRHDRALLEDVLDASDVDALRDQVRAEAPALLADPGPVDVVRCAKALAVRVAAERLGVRGLAADTLVELCHDVFVGIFVNLDEDPVLTQRAVDARDQLRAHLVRLAERVRSSASRSDDTLSRLVAASSAGRIDQERVVDQLIGLVVGLVDNVVAGVCSAVDELLARPDVLVAAQRAAEAPGRDLEQLVWEVLRFAPPAPLLVRTTTAAYKLSTGTTVPPGRLVIAVTAAAMVDPRRFPDPYAVDARRADGSLHFGAGLHECLGRHLGGTVVVEAVRAFLHAGVRAAPAPDPGLLRRGDRPVRFTVRLEGQP